MAEVEVALDGAIQTITLSRPEKLNAFTPTLHEELQAAHGLPLTWYDVLIQLQPKHGPTRIYQDRIRRALALRFPGVDAYFQAADIISQVLNLDSARKSAK